MPLDELLRIVNKEEDLRICIYKSIAVHQREDELRRGLNLDGTLGYEITGCYECDGHDYICKTYLSLAYVTANKIGLKK